MERLLCSRRTGKSLARVSRNQKSDAEQNSSKRFRLRALIN